MQANHDDVMKWRQFPRCWPFVRGIHRSPVNSLHKGQWRAAFVFSLICVWINGWVNNREAGDLRYHRAHYDVIVMWMRGEWFRSVRHRVRLSCEPSHISRPVEMQSAACPRLLTIGTNYSEILIEIYKFSFTKMHLKVSSGKWLSFCLGLNVLIACLCFNFWGIYYQKYIIIAGTISHPFLQITSAQ